MKKFLQIWFSDFCNIFYHELHAIIHDSGVMIILIVAGFCYPLLYNYIYSNGVLNETPVAVVDEADCSDTRRFIREVDATRELEIAFRCCNMAEAEALMKQRKVEGIIYFPADFGEKIAAMEQATVSIYANMSSFLYYKNLLIGTEFVMLHEINQIQFERYAAAGLSEVQAEAMVQAVPYEENLPYNRTFSYNIFLISGIIFLIIQQVMFISMSVRFGTEKEENKNGIGTLPENIHGLGISRVVFSRGAAYFFIFMIIGVYVTFIVPAVCGFPQRGQFGQIMNLLVLYVLDCVVFSQTWSSLISRRENVFVMFLFMSPVCLFLTGLSWPTTSFPTFWKGLSYLFPSTFGCQAFTNLNTAGAGIESCQLQIQALFVQTCIYYFVACLLLYLQNWFTGWKEKRMAWLLEKQQKLEAKSSVFARLHEELEEQHIDEQAGQ